MQNKAFTKGGASLFIISSPFQLMCAYEAIHEFELCDYEIIALMHDKDNRKDQFLNILNYFKLHYIKLNVSCIKTSKLLLGKAPKNLNINKYDRVFVGDYYRVGMQSLALCLCKSGGSIVYLDDGVDTIAILQGIMLKFTRKNKLLRNLFCLKAKLKGIDPLSCFFTIYSDVKTDRSIYPNTFSTFNPTHAPVQNIKECYFIGTNPMMYNQYVGITIEQYYSIIDRLLSSIKNENKDADLIYIPHGKDSDEYTKCICQKHGFRYLRLSETIELYFIKQSLIPYSIYGLLSTALFNLKKMYPTVYAINYFLNKHDYPHFDKDTKTASYYSSNGIERIDVDL